VDRRAVLPRRRRQRCAGRRQERHHASRFLEEAAKLHDFTASVDGDGMLGPTDVGGHRVSPSFLLMQVKENRYVRVFPKQANTFDCDPKNVFTIKLDQS
jgi:hypothetical protein